MPQLTAHAHAHGREDGVAMVMAVAMVIIIGIVASVALSVSGTVTREVTDSARRSGAMLVAEGAASSIAQALQARGDVLADSLDVTPVVIRSAAELSGGTVLTGAPFDYGWPASTPTQLQFTVVDGTGPERTSWQVVALRGPDISASPPRSWATVFIRAWVGTGASRSRAAIVKARFRPGTFFDYQVISDVSIQFEAGTQITGNVHTNGFIDDVLLPPGSVYDRIWTSSGTASCTTPAGGTRPVVSTAQGQIAGIDASSCTRRANTGESVSLARAASSFRAMQANCTAAGVRCYTSSHAASVPYVVSLGSTTADVTVRLNGFLLSTPLPNGAGGRALLFDRDVVVSGEARGRLTIATRSTSPAVPATSIRIVGNTGIRTPGALPADRHALALIAEHDVVLDTTSACFSRVRAALVASTGAVTIPREHRASVVSSGARLCPSIALSGAIASHGSIILRWNSGSTTVGFSGRTYAWDPWLAYYPPPFVPLAHPWEMSGLEVASGDCLQPGGAGGAACA